MGAQEPFGNPLERILFCTDFSENADFAFHFAVDAASRRPGCMLYLLHVVPEPEARFWNTYLYEVEDVEEKGRGDMERRIADAYLSHTPPGVHVQIAICVGRESEAILRFAEEKDVDLIVMGRQGSSALGTLLFGNVAEVVARKAACAVLIVPLRFKRRLDARRGNTDRE